MENENVKMGYGVFVSDEIVNKKETLFTLTKVAKIIDKKSIGRNKLYKILRDLKYINENNFCLQKYIDEGYFVDSKTRRNAGDFHVFTNQILVTIKGLELIKEIVKTM